MVERGVGRRAEEALPDSGDDRPTSIRIVEVLPAPFGPSNAQIWPASTLKLSRLTACLRP